MQRSPITEQIKKQFPIIYQYTHANEIEIVRGQNFKNDGAVINVHLDKPAVYFFKNTSKKVKSGQIIKIFGDYHLSRESLVMRLFLRGIGIFVEKPVFPPVDFKNAEIPDYININRNFSGYNKLIGNYIFMNINALSEFNEILAYFEKNSCEIIILTQFELDYPAIEFLYRFHEVKLNAKLTNVFCNLYNLSNLPRKNNAFEINVDEAVYRPPHFIEFINSTLRSQNGVLDSDVKVNNFNDFIDYPDDEKNKIIACGTIGAAFTKLQIKAFSYCFESIPIEFPNIGLKIYHYYDGELDKFIREHLVYPKDFGYKIIGRQTAIFPLNAGENRIISNAHPLVKAAPDICWDIEDKREMFFNKEHLRLLGGDFEFRINRMVDFINNVVTPIRSDKFTIQITASLMQSGLRNHLDGFKKNGEILVVFNLNTRIYYDMLPIFTNKGKPTRVKLNSGDVILMTGASRYAWSHSYSADTPLAKKRFNIVFRGFSR